MSQSIAEIINPLIEKGLFDNPETAIRNLITDYILHKIHHYQSIIHKFEKKYGMNYFHFNKYLAERATNLSNKSSLHKQLMLEEEDALDWMIAAEMLESWLCEKKMSEIKNR